MKLSPPDAARVVAALRSSKGDRPADPADVRLADWIERMAAMEREIGEARGVDALICRALALILDRSQYISPVSFDAEIKAVLDQLDKVRS